MPLNINNIKLRMMSEANKPLTLTMPDGSRLSMIVVLGQAPGVIQSTGVSFALTAALGISESIVAANLNSAVNTIVLGSSLSLVTSVGLTNGFNESIGNIRIGYDSFATSIANSNITGILKSNVVSLATSDSVSLISGASGSLGDAPIIAASIGETTVFVDIESIVNSTGVSNGITSESISAISDIKIVGIVNIGSNVDGVINTSNQIVGNIDSESSVNIISNHTVGVIGNIDSESSVNIISNHTVGVIGNIDSTTDTVVKSMSTFTTTATSIGSTIVSNIISGSILQSDMFSVAGADTQGISNINIETNAISSALSTTSGLSSITANTNLLAVGLAQVSGISETQDIWQFAGPIFINIPNNEGWIFDNDIFVTIPEAA